MPPIENGDNTEFTLEELEALFPGNSAQETPPAQEQNTEPSATQPAANESNIEVTKAFSQRLKAKTDEAVKNERENIAKSMGYASYEEMIKQREAKLMEDKGLDPEQVTPVVDELVKQRIDNDPRMQELEELRAQKLKIFAEQQLAEITKLTDGEITDLKQIPKEVLDLWQQKGSLKQAYLAVKGEELLIKAKSGQSKGTTQHLQSVQGGPAKSTAERPLTEQEKRVWRQFYPNITEEELNKKTMKI